MLGKKLTIGVNRNAFSLPAYVYQSTVMIPPQRSYEGMSLQEISERFGREDALGVYYLACRGRDLTKVQQPHHMVTDNVDFMLSSDDSQLHRLYICANEFTPADEDHLVMEVEINDFALLQDLTIAIKLAEDAIRRLNPHGQAS
ncbi:MAG: hypothetical protein KAV87_55515 [Desulfobacteraceae bacterium]|nr:hypothetical protein [Desulfobacteraceae bacterium]